MRVEIEIRRHQYFFGFCRFHFHYCHQALLLIQRIRIWCQFCQIISDSTKRSLLKFVVQFLQFQARKLDFALRKICKRFYEVFVFYCFLPERNFCQRLEVKCKSYDVLHRDYLFGIIASPSN